jgi:protein involved in polysaccharide export with SLBB domain
MNIKFLLVFLFLSSTFLLLSQSTSRIITGASQNEIDTMAFDAMKELNEEKKNLLEKAIDPDKYILGPNDVFNISIITAVENINFKPAVSPEGYLMLEGAGYVKIKDKTLSEAYLLIKEQLNKYYNTDNIFIVLDDIRKFKVYVTGALGKSMSVPATSTDRVSEIIDKAGGAKYNSSVRNIKLRRANQLIQVDLLKYYFMGDEDANPYVTGGDIIIVPLHDKYSEIGIYGEVLNPGEFEFVDGDMFSDLLSYGQGFTASAKKDEIIFKRFSDSRKELIERTIDLSDYKNFLEIRNSDIDFELKRGDRIYVRKIHNWDKIEYVIIEGEVKYPGKYGIVEGKMTINELLDKCGGFTDDASLENAEFIRQLDLLRQDPEMERLSKLPPSEMSKSEFKYYQARVREKRGVISVDFNSFREEGKIAENILLFHKDSIVIPRRNEFVNVQGRVNAPGKIKYEEGLTYLDYIQKAGGFGFRSEPDETLVTKSQGEIFLAKDMNYIIEPGDVVLVPPEDEVTFMEVFTQALTITAELATVFGIILTIVNMN